MSGQEGGGWSIDVKRIATTDGREGGFSGTSIDKGSLPCCTNLCQTLSCVCPEFLLPVMCKGGKIAFVSPGR